MHLLRSFWKRILDDLKQKKLVPLKVLCFVYASTQLVLYPYLTIHMRELGISVEETAVMSSLTPLFLIMIPPLAGLFADKIGNFRLLLALTSTLGGLAALLLLLVPIGRQTVVYPPSVNMIASCEGSSMRLLDVSQYPCQPLYPYAQESNITIATCGFVCQSNDTTKDELDELLRSSSYSVIFKSKTRTQRLIYRNILKTFSTDSSPTKAQKRIRKLNDNLYYNSTLTKFSDDEIFFPTPQLFKMNCDYEESNATCTLGKFDFSSELVRDVEDYRVRITHQVDEDSDEETFWVNAILNGNESNIVTDFDGVDSTKCIDRFKEIQNDISMRVQVGSRQFLQCFSACATQVPRATFCSNSQEQIEIDPAFTFWTYMAIRVLIGIISGTSFALFEGAVIAIIREHRADYGMQKVYGSVGGMISSPLSGLLIDYASRGKGFTDFRPAFYLYAVLKVLSGVLVLSLDLEFKKPAKTLVKDVITVFKNFEIVALLIVCIVMGTAWGFLESFLFWFLQDLGASQSLMGITITVGGVAGLPLLVLSGPIISKIGHSNVLFIGFIFYAIRLFGYSFIHNPWLSLIFEAMESVTLSLSFTAAVTYAALLSSKTTDSSVQGLLGGLYYGVGKGAGSLIGGYLMKFFGTRPTYRLFAAATFITGCIYFLFNRFVIRKLVKCRENDISKKNTVLDLEAETKRENTAGLNGDKSELTSMNHLKLAKENTDGSSDSGVENPVFVDNESPPEDLKRSKDSV